MPQFAAASSGCATSFTRGVASASPPPASPADQPARTGACERPDGDAMAIRSDEIISIIKSKIESFDETTETRSVGTVVEVGDGIAQVYGLDAALMSELLEFPNGVMGMA